MAWTNDSHCIRAFCIHDIFVGTEIAMRVAPKRYPTRKSSCYPPSVSRYRSKACLMLQGIN